MEKVWGLDSDAEINVVWVNIPSRKISDANVTIKSARFKHTDGRSVIPMILEKKRSLHV